MMSKEPMFFKKDEYDFEKPDGGNMVTVSRRGREFDVFTNYDIGDDYKAFQESCLEYIEYLDEANM